MKKRKSYYFRLTVFSVSVLLIAVFLVTGAILNSLRHEQEIEMLSDCDVVLNELVEGFNNIQEEYYKVFRPLFTKDNMDELLLFCGNNDRDMNLYTLHSDIISVFKEVCSQDSRIKGLYFCNFYDGSQYLYDNEGESLKKVDLNWGAINSIDGVYKRALLGGRTIDIRYAKNGQNVFGVQSGAISVGSGDNKYTYRITVLYSLDYLDSIVERYQKNEDARFLITSAQGEVFYDSYKDYAYYTKTEYEDFDYVIGVKDSFVKDGITYLTGEFENHRNYLAFYVMPEASIRNFQLTSNSVTVILVALIICLIVVMIMITSNRFVMKRFRTILEGIQLVGQNNLDYRIPISNKEDEFSVIAKSFNEMCDLLQKAIEQNYIYLVQQKNAEYDALQKSVNPHFLYNSLEVIREMLLEAGQEDFSEMVVLLSRIYEYQLRGESVVSIRTESSLLKTYAEFFSIRSKYGFQYTLDFSEEIMNCQVPKFIMQPIMENYFVHGFKGDEDDYISIQGYLDPKDEYIHICFKDNGKGITQEQAKYLSESLNKDQENHSHIGLYNVNKRLKYFFGEKSYLDIKSNAPEAGVSVYLVFQKLIK